MNIDSAKICLSVQVGDRIWPFMWDEEGGRYQKVPKAQLPDELVILGQILG